MCDKIIGEIADNLEPRSFTSREFIHELGKYLKKKAKKKDSLIEVAYDNNVPIFCPAFTDSSAGFGLVMHQERNPKKHITIDSIKEFRELTEIKIRSKGSGLFMIGGGVPKNFIQDTVICAELLGKNVDMHKYAIQITVADSRDGACSSSTLKEASSWGKVDVTQEQMVFAEATSVLPLIASDAYHKAEWKNRQRKNFSKFLGRKIELFIKQKGFLGIDNKFNFKEKAVVIPFGLEKTVSYGSGTKNGPREIIKASHQVELYDEELNCEPFKQIGIKTLKPFKINKNIRKAIDQIANVNEKILDQKLFPITLGGEHSITPGCIKPFVKKFKKLTLLHFDAHADLRESYAGEKFSMHLQLKDV